MTQKERIMRHLRDHGSITSREAVMEYGIMRLASRISELKREGVCISTRHKHAKNRYGEETWFAEYSLDEVHTA